ncbi:MAG: YgiT-type zinc finger protein [Acidobacteria bacterium]|nr:YgiT-type zinc finger protein [Acidobacteriota bacterium]MBI3656359.1 YgiT-type zinc finger protein [Acidobacteriota bacterium]
MSQKKAKIYKCPSCKEGTTEIKKINYQLKAKGGRKIIIPDLEIEECTHCGERIFGMKAARLIEVHKAHSGRLLVRLKPEVHAQLRELARKHHRSLNQEINFLLETGVDKAS